MADPYEYMVFKRTIYTECREEPLEAQKYVAWVIKNRADKFGLSIAAVCKTQFACWLDGFHVQNPRSFGIIDLWLPEIYKAAMNEDPTGGCDDYNIPGLEGYLDDEGYKVTKMKNIGNLTFYKTKEGDDDSRDEDTASTATTGLSAEEEHEDTLHASTDALFSVEDLIDNLNDLLS